MLKLALLAFPNTWTLHNFAALLALRPQIIHIALFTRLSEGRTDEAAHVFHAIKTVRTPFSFVKGSQKTIWNIFQEIVYYTLVDCLRLGILLVDILQLPCSTPLSVIY